MINQVVDFINSKQTYRLYELIRYITVGATCAFVEYIVFLISVTCFDVYYLTANVLAFCVSFSLGFLFQKLWTFKNYEKKYGLQIAKSLLVIGIGFCLNNFLVYFFIGVLGLSIFIGKPLQLFLVFFWNYSGQRFWTFKNIV